MTVAVLGLGGNIGDPRKTMASALAALAASPGIAVEAVSALYSTPPWGKTDQPPFLNAAVRIEAGLSPHALLAAILAIERRHGRERTERWGPRSIDIDILVFGADEVDEPGLHIPHPRLPERAFALAPLLDVMPDAIVAGRKASEWLALSDTSGMTCLAEPGWQSPG